MLSALIPPVGRKPAVPLAGQLAHESYVRPGPLVLGTAFLKSPTAASDRDRHLLLPPTDSAGGQDISAWLCMSPCRSDHIFTFSSAKVLGIWSLRILDSELGDVVCTDHHRSFEEPWRQAARSPPPQDAHPQPSLSRLQRRC